MQTCDTSVVQSNATNERRRGLSMVHYFKILTSLKILLRTIPKCTISPDTPIGGVNQVAWDSVCDPLQDIVNYRNSHQKCHQLKESYPQSNWQITLPLECEQRKGKQTSVVDSSECVT